MDEKVELDTSLWSYKYEEVRIHICFVIWMSTYLRKDIPTTEWMRLWCACHRIPDLHFSL